MKQKPIKKEVKNYYKHNSSSGTKIDILHDFSQKNYRSIQWIENEMNSFKKEFAYTVKTLDDKIKEIERRISIMENIIKFFNSKH
jgi:hypothetical protein